MIIFFGGGTLWLLLLLLLMLRFRVVVWKLQNVVFIAIPKTLHPATAITTRIHHPRGIPSNNKPKKQEQRNTTSSYLAHAPPSSSSSSSSCFLFSYLLAYAFYQQTLSRTTFPFGILAKKSNFKT